EMLGEKEPNRISELQSLLGSYGYFQRYIMGYAEIVAPLRALLKKGSKFIWGKPQKEAFEKLKQSIQDPCTLAQPLTEAPKTISIVVANNAIIGVCSQEVQGERQILECVSKSLSDTETRYARVEKEILAMVHAINKFAPLLG